MLAGGERIACDHVLVGDRRPARHRLARARTDVGPPPAPRTSSPPATPSDRGHWEAAAARAWPPRGRCSACRAAPPALPLVWSDQHGVRIQRLGDPRGADGAEIDGDLAARDFTVTYHRAGRPVAAVLVGRPGALPAVRRRLTAGPRPERNAA